MKTLLMTTLTTLLLLGCNESPKSSKEDNPIIPKSSSEALKKAKEVEQKLKKAAEKRKVQIEKSGND